MTRHLCRLALLGLLLVPDWAAACRPMGWGHVTYVQPAYPACPVAYPVYPVCVPPPVYVCPPAPGYQLPPPRVERTPRMATPAPAPSPPAGSDAARPRPSRPPVVEPVRPAGGSDTIPAQVVPAAPPPKKADAPRVVPDPMTKAPEVAVPMDLGPLPKLDVPVEPDFRPAAPPKDAGTSPKAATPPVSPIPGASVGGVAVPTPAPAMPEPLIPSPGVPALPDPKTPAELPSLTLPPDSPVQPRKDSTSRSSPLAGGSGPTVEVFPAEGAANAVGGYKSVGFYNHTDRDLNLVIEGQAVKLPAKSYIPTLLAPSFTWGQSGQKAVRQTVPAGASGVDVVFRE